MAAEAPPLPATSEEEEEMLESKNNPLLQDFVFPPYDLIEPKHIRPAIKALLKELENDLIELEKTVKPTWPDLVYPLEKIVDRELIVWRVVCHLKSVKDSPELRIAFEELQPLMIEFDLKVAQSKPIYNAFKSIRESSDWQTLSDARKRVVEGQIKEANLNGVSLEDEKREQFNRIKQELETLSQKFEENVINATRNFERLITDKSEIEGLTAATLGLAAQTAASKGHENATAEDGPWVITLDNKIFSRVMTFAANRSLREEVYRAFETRASDGDLDNTPIINQILKLRLEQAKLLGYNNYAELTMTAKMATVDKAEELLEKLRAAAWKAAVQEIEDLRNFCRDQGAEEANDFSIWDMKFWSLRFVHSKNGRIKNPFPLPEVMEGLFNLAKKLFEIDIDPADGLAPVWNKDVKFYSVKDSAGKPIAYFYFDPYSRPSEKHEGAWMDEVVSRRRALALDGDPSRLPVAYIACNQRPPVGDKPSLITFKEVKSVFHEFGHALQHMLTKEDEGLVSGCRGIERDALKVPSQFMRNWCYHRGTLMSTVKHYKTRETLPEEDYNRLLAMKTFNAGTRILREIGDATIDFELHMKYVPGGAESIHDMYRRVCERTRVIPVLPESKYLCSFRDIFSGGYGAGYYSNKWAEVLSADAYSAFEEAGLDNDKAVKELGHKFRDTILARGNGKPPLEVFVDFRGREPSLEALLRYYGLVTVREKTEKGQSKTEDRRGLKRRMDS